MGGAGLGNGYPCCLSAPVGVFWICLLRVGRGFIMRRVVRQVPGFPSKPPGCGSSGFIDLAATFSTPRRRG